MTEFPDFYDHNMALLKERQPNVWQMMMDNEPPPVGKICRAQNDSLNLRLDGHDGSSILLHKDTNPESEADDFAANIPAGHIGFVALLGMGLGYAALGILERLPLLQSFAVFERDPGIFRQAVEHIDLSSLLMDKRLILGIGSENKVSTVLAPAARTLQLEGSRVLHHTQSFEFDPEGYRQLKEELFLHLNGMNVGGMTVKHLGRNFLNNRFRHITTIHHQRLLEDLHKTFAGVPAILVAGGPSLDKNIHILKQVQDRAVIMAVDTVLPALLEHGINPHFLTSIDPNNLTYEKFADVIPKVKDTSLICSSWVNPRTPQNFPARQVFWTFTAKPMEAWLNSLLGGKIFTGGASTVAHLNLVAADILGCDPVIFIGQDLAYPQTASHAHGTVLQGSAPTDTMLSGNTEGQLVKGIDGTMLRTDRSFLSMKDFFESAIANSTKKFINATEGGAHIEGTEVLTLQETIDLYCSRETKVWALLDERMRADNGVDNGQLLQKFHHTLGKAKVLQKHITEADRLCRSVRRELADTIKKRGRVRAFNMLPPKTQRKIEKIDKLHKKLDNAEIWHVLEEITMAGLQLSERERQAVAALENDSAKYPEWLEQNLNRLLNINSTRQETLGLLVGNLKNILSFNKQENLLLDKIAKGENRAENNLLLLRHYMNEGSYALARPIVEKLLTERPDCGDAYYALGCIKALRSEFVESGENFKRAMTIDPLLAGEVEKFQRQLANDFLTYTRYFKAANGRWPSVIYMVKKGLKFVPDHEQLLAELNDIIREDMGRCKVNIDNVNLTAAAKNIEPWYEYLDSERRDLLDRLPPDLAADVYLHHGRLLFREEKGLEAAADFRKGLVYTPKNIELHSALLDALFAAGDFNEAILALNQAIKINHEFASYWEGIGDSLYNDGQYSDAVLAYEQGFIQQPEHINLLKKMGDCYREDGQLEAAKATYEQVKDSMVKLTAGGNIH